MSKLVKQTENELKIIIENAVNKAMASGDLPQAEIPQFNIEKPANKDNGDYFFFVVLFCVCVFF